MLVKQKVRNRVISAKTYFLGTLPNSNQVALSDKTKFILDSLKSLSYY